MTGPLRERDDADVLLAAETERALAGTGRLVLLRGASGTGRTAVLDSAARGAADRGLRVLRARCSPDDTAVPFATVVQLLGPVPEFTEVASADDERGSAALLWRLLRAYADEGPVLLAVDDVHLADDPSRRWLADAARRIDRLPVLLVATERSQYDVDPRPAGLTQALSPSLVRTHTLAPLSDRAAAGLVRAAFPEACATWAAECVRAGAGSPLLLHALLDDLGGTPHPDGLPPVPDTAASLYPGSYPAAVSWWLKSAGPVTAEVARSLAALEQAWPAAAPARRGEHRHALPHPEARARGGGDTAPGCRDVWSAEHEGDGDGGGFAGRGGAVPGTPGAFPQAPGATAGPARRTARPPPDVRGRPRTRRRTGRRGGAPPRPPPRRRARGPGTRWTCWPRRSGPTPRGSPAGWPP